MFTTPSCCDGLSEGIAICRSEDSSYNSSSICKGFEEFKTTVRLERIVKLKGKVYAGVSTRYNLGVDLAMVPKYGTHKQAGL